MSNTVFHGGRLDLAIEKYGGRREEWLDLSTGINPNAYPVEGLGEKVWQSLPDGKALADLMEAARRYYKVPKSVGMIAANGTQALIELLPRVMASKRVAIVSPTYGEHAHTWRKSGAHVEFISKGEAIPRLCNTMVIVNPNNPDGTVYSPHELTKIATEMKLQNGYLIVDEAFCDPNPEHSIVPNLQENVLVYRSFGKFFGLAGIRLGFLIGVEKTVHQLENLLGPWCVSGPALELGRRAFHDDKWIGDMRKQLQAQAAKQAEMFSEIGLEVCGVNPLFIYAGHERASEIFESLAAQKILIRPFPEKSSRLRFGICKDDDELARLNDALIHAMERL